MSESGQTRKPSMRAYVFRYSPNNVRTTALRQKSPVAKPLDKTSDLIRKCQNLPASL
jgi:hypothetical protein